MIDFFKAWEEWKRWYQYAHSDKKEIITQVIKDLEKEETLDDVIQTLYELEEFEILDVLKKTYDQQGKAFPEIKE